MPITWQWFFVIHSHFAPPSQKFQRVHSIIQWQNNWLIILFIYFLSNVSTLKNSNDIYVIRHIITKKIGIQFYCGMNFLNTFYKKALSEPWLLAGVISTEISCVGYTVNPVLSGHSKKDKTNVLKTNGSLIKVKSIAECSLGAFCNTFDLH